MMTTSYEKELVHALLAVSRAVILTQSVFHSTKTSISKSDASPVTIGDFGAQALIISSLRHAFPQDDVIAEEEASALRNDHGLAEQIWTLVKNTRLDSSDEEAALGGAVKGKEDMLHIIDSGGAAGGPAGRVWALDPIDGTKGFLRGGQYAVCLALIEDGDVRVGVLACPNLQVDDAAPLSADVNNGTDRGVLFCAVTGQGAHSRLLSTGALKQPKRIQMKQVEKIADATFCESVEAGHSSHGDQAAIAKILGITKESVRMDSQAKYGSIARGAGDLYLRLPVKKGYEEKIWDHAAGDLIVREAGGEVTDARGERLDFSLGRTLKNNTGVVAAPRDVYGKVLEAVRKVLEGKEEQT